MLQKETFFSIFIILIIFIAWFYESCKNIISNLNMWLWKSQEIVFQVYKFIYLVVWRRSCYIYVVQLMKQVLINPIENHHYIWLYNKSLIIKNWWSFYPKVLNFFMFQYFYFNCYIIFIYFINYNSTQWKAYNNVLLWSRTFHMCFYSTTRLVFLLKNLLGH